MHAALSNLTLKQHVVIIADMKASVYGRLPGRYTSVEDLLVHRGLQFGKPIKSKLQGPMKCCYSTCHEYARRYRNLTYCEGVAFSERVGSFPIDHAWLLTERGEVIEPTWHDGIAYLGIPFQIDFVTDMMLKQKHFGVFTNPRTSRALCYNFAIRQAAIRPLEPVASFTKERQCATTPPSNQLKRARSAAAA
jgi:hypothetical protein